MVDKILKGIESKEAYVEVYNNDSAKGKHEFLFFLKPEVLGITPGTDLKGVLNLTEEKIKEFGLEVYCCKVIRSEYLKEYKIMNQHYGVIGEISGDASSMSKKAKEKFKEDTGKDLSEVKAMGGHQFLETYPEYTTSSLDEMWQKGKANKLAGGTYYREIEVDGETVYLLNGFFPQYVEHFIAEGRFLVIFTLRGDLDWEKARQDFIGATDPEAANPGSLRYEFRKKADDLGLGEIGKSSNGAHLSAGPVEGLVELIRFNSNLTTGNKLDASHFQFGKSMLEKMPDSNVAFWLQNNKIKVDGKEEPSFDATEEMNAAEVLKFI